MRSIAIEHGRVPSRKEHGGFVLFNLIPNVSTKSFTFLNILLRKMVSNVKN